jgi:tRNA pseudouridine38-40 synthase
MLWYNRCAYTERVSKVGFAVQHQYMPNVAQQVVLGSGPQSPCASRSVYQLIIAYDGSRYFGWQKTRFGPSIQEMIERAALQILPGPIEVEGASRTDRGVHATGQSAHLATDVSREPGALLRGLNAHLPSDIRITEAGVAPSTFHATLDARSKEYLYRLHLDSAHDPLTAHYAWHIHRPLDLGLMREAAAHCLGRRDFTAFANEKPTQPFCSLTHLSIGEEGTIRLVGDRFLYNMVRIIVGTLVYVGAGKLAPTSIPAILASRERKRAGPTAPAHGLCLSRVDYSFKLEPYDSAQ